MAREHDGAGERAQRRRQELGRVVVEVVRRLVEQQRAGLTHQQRGEPEPRPLPARERADGAAGDAVDVESQAGERARGARVGVPHLRELGPVEGARVRLLDPRAGPRDGPRAVRAREGEGRLLELALDRPDAGQRVVDDRTHGRRRRVGELLVQEPEVVGPGHGPVVGRERAREHAQQGGLADAVLADETRAVAGVDGEVDAAQHGTAREGHADVGRTEDRGGTGHGAITYQGARAARARARDGAGATTTGSTGRSGRGR
ncbi:hypothetical protein M768_11070 [Cellulosimicrobium cellulans F16]|uniref:Uncharacterized protein n=1 Tax=Cellulosimicrobium cellulans F16 TaxID=1350482 RepID=A0A0M0F7D6_CELCE|nr:hypothetical protein M768_11070 [Cellulosimicrobium cellulans F16]